MKYAKMLGLLAVAAAALMAFVGTASATELTSPKGTKLLNGTVIKATSEGHTVLDGSVNITCNLSHVEGEITDTGGKDGSGNTKTVKGKITKLEFTECGTTTVTPVAGALGELEIHSIGNNTGTVTSNGTKVTVLTHSFFLGTTHCIYSTNGTHIGTLTGTGHRNNSKTTATLDIGSAPIPQESTDGLCGSDAEWTGNYEITSPDHLYVD